MVLEAFQGGPVPGLDDVEVASDAHRRPGDGGQVVQELTLEAAPPQAALGGHAVRRRVDPDHPDGLRPCCGKVDGGDAGIERGRGDRGSLETAAGHDRHVLAVLPPRRAGNVEAVGFQPGENEPAAVARAQLGEHQDVAPRPMSHSSSGWARSVPALLTLSAQTRRTC